MNKKPIKGKQTNDISHKRGAATSSPSKSGNKKLNLYFNKLHLLPLVLVAVAIVCVGVLLLVCESNFLWKSQELNLFLCGIGTVGSRLIAQIQGQRQKLMDENNEDPGMKDNEKGYAVAAGMSGFDAALSDFKGILHSV